MVPLKNLNVAASIKSGRLQVKLGFDYWVEKVAIVKASLIVGVVSLIGLFNNDLESRINLVFLYIILLFLTVLSGLTLYRIFTGKRLSKYQTNLSRQEIMERLVAYSHREGLYVRRKAADHLVLSDSSDLKHAAYIYLLRDGEVYFSSLRMTNRRASWPTLFSHYRIKRHLKALLL